MLFVIDNAQPQGYSQKFRSILSHANNVGNKIDATPEHHFSNLRCTRECTTLSAGHWSIGLGEKSKIKIKTCAVGF